jgi:transmembrane sensor
MIIQMNLKPKHSATQTIHSPGNTLNDQASQWFAKIRSGNMSVGEHNQFQQWLLSNPAHKKTYDEVEAFWNDPDFREALTIIPLSQGCILPQRNKHKSWVVLAIAACLALLAILLRPMMGCLQADYCTAIGETRNVQLADGSTVILSPQTAIKIAMSPESRYVNILEGEAFFSVQRNPTRPFIVDSQYSQTRVLGTQFNVKGNAQSDTVTVISGVVEVSHNQQQPSVLHANDKITVANNTSSAIEPSSGSTASAWTKGHLVFANAPLREVVAEIGRYRKGTVIVKNSQLKALQVSGRFDIKNTDNALQALEQTLPIHVYHLTPWLVIIV